MLCDVVCDWGHRWHPVPCSNFPVAFQRSSFTALPWYYFRPAVLHCGSTLGAASSLSVKWSPLGMQALAHYAALKRGSVQAALDAISRFAALRHAAGLAFVEDRKLTKVGSLDVLERPHQVVRAVLTKIS